MGGAPSPKNDQSCVQPKLEALAGPRSFAGRTFCRRLCWWLWLPSARISGALCAAWVSPAPNGELGWQLGGGGCFATKSQAPLPPPPPLPPSEAASAELDRNTRNRLVRGVIVGALYPQVGQWPAPTLPDGRKVSPATVELRGGSRAKLHPSSVLHPRGQDAPAASAWLCFSERVQTSQVFLRDNTLVSPTALLLFGGSSSASSSSSNVGLEIVPEHRVVALPGQRAWMAFDCAPQLAVALRVLRRRLDQLVDADLSRGEGDEGLEDSAGGALQPADEDERRDLRIAILGLL